MPTPPLRVAILGNDAVLAAQPATPTQLAQACLRAAFDLVAPASWGDELVAHYYADTLGERATPVSLLCHCPTAMAGIAQLAADVDVIAAVAPPLAAARYLRYAYAPRPLIVTYLGVCPAATAPDIDAVVTPERLLALLADAGLAPVTQSELYHSLMPPDRGRYASHPGGVPNADILQRQAGVTLREISLGALKTTRLAPPAHERIAFDCTRLSGCACAAQAERLAALEPPRRDAPVVAQFPLDLSAVALRTASA
ncbi:MAG: hypothetical protein ACT4R6_01195 [Gemmatimonadaceae bacterium]